MKKYTVLLIIIIMALMSGSGCYTVLRHSNDEQGITDYGDNYNEDYGYSQYYYPSYWTLSPRWGRYYAVPWWWDYGYYHSSGPIYYEDNDSPRSSGGEKATPNSHFPEVSPSTVPIITRGTSGASTSSPSPGITTKQKPASNETESNTSNVQTKTKEPTQDNTDSKPTRQERKK